MRTTVEKQYQFMVNMQHSKGLVPMSIRASTMYRTDPKLLVFTLARHKFVAKMLDGYERVVAVGCGDAFADRLVQQTVRELHGCDFDPVFIEDAKARSEPEWPMIFAVHNFLQGPYRSGGLFDAAYSLDVIEHIPRTDEDRFVQNLAASIKPEGVVMIGTPSLESQIYASVPSKEGHVNCKTAKDLKMLMQKYFHQVFIFSMNDELVHTGYYPMAHYLFALCCSVK